MELLAGARDDAHLNALRRLISRSTMLGVIAEDYDRAAMLYRQCRLVGMRVRRLTDCLIAAVAIRNDVAVLHVDRDLDVLASVVPLRIDG